ncbi:MAG: hypothetical protein AAF430_05185 [Myxococcota bacterium]
MRKTSIALLALFGALLGASAATAQTGLIGVRLTADGDGRWFEFQSDAFCQVDGGTFYPGAPGADGFYLISTGAPIGSGITCFPDGPNFGGVGGTTGFLEVDLSGVTGTGVEMAPITDVLIEFNDYIADDDALFGLQYTSAYSVTSGTATLTNGVVTDVDVMADVTFTYDVSQICPPSLLLDYTGTLEITSTSFDLLVNSGALVTCLGNARWDWDVMGAATQLPEPSGPWALLSAGGLLWALRRRHTA